MTARLARATALFGFTLLAASAWGQDYAAEIELSRMPSSMSPNSTATFDVTVRNTGSKDWPNTTFICVDAYEDPLGNYVEQTAFYARKQIGALPSGQANSAFGSAAVKIEAPEQRGLWKLRAWVVAGGRECDGDALFEVEVQDGYYGSFADFSGPEEMIPGLEYTMRIEVENTGDVQWDTGEVVLESKVKRTLSGSSAEGKAAFDKRHTIENEDIVYAGGSYNFAVRFTAPPNNGQWELEWRLYDLVEKRPFGQAGTSTHAVATNEGGYAVRLEVDRAPSSLEVNERGTVQVTVENAGKDLPDDAIVLVSARRDPHGNRAGQTAFSDEAEIGALAAGKEAQVELDIIGASTRGEWELIVWVEVGGRKVSNEEHIELDVEGYYEGRISDVDFEEEQEASGSCTVTLKAENTGDLFWADGGVGVDVRVRRTVSGNASDGKSAFEQKHEVTNGDDVEPGDRYDFEIDFDLPDEPGEWEIEFELYDVDARRNFATPEVITVTVVADD